MYEPKNKGSCIETNKLLFERCSQLVGSLASRAQAFGTWESVTCVPMLERLAA